MIGENKSNIDKIILENVPDVDFLMLDIHLLSAPTPKWY